MELIIYIESVERKIFLLRHLSSFINRRLRFLQSPPRRSEEVERQEVERRRWFVRVSKWHVNVDCGQYRRRTSEGRPTFFPSQHTDKSISSRAVVSRFPAAPPGSTAGSLTHRPIVHDETGPRSPPFSTILPSDSSYYFSSCLSQHPFIFRLGSSIFDFDRFSRILNPFVSIMDRRISSLRIIRNNIENKKRK